MESVKAIKNVSYTLISNLLSTVISVVVTLIVPKIVGVEQYSYFQLYTFYIGYVNFLNFGQTEGILLKYGGGYYNKLDYPKFKGQLVFLFWTQVFIGLGMSILALEQINDIYKKYVLLFLAISTVLISLRTYFLYVLQGTNRIKDYSMVVLVDKFIYIILVAIFMFIRSQNSSLYIFSYVLGLFIACIAGALYCKDIIFAKLPKISELFKESWDNMSVGIKLVIANSAGMLIIGIIRQSIEIIWNVEVFGKVSLTFSISNMLVTLINAVSIVLFPMLRRMEFDKIEEFYSKMRDILMVILLTMLAFYYPGKVLLSMWLPEYSDSLKYMALLFPICIYESKMSMLVNTYLKTMRKEKIIMIVNLITLFLSVILSGLTIFIMKNLEMAIFSIVILLAFRCILAELILSKYLNIEVKKDIFIELLLTIMFIFMSWFIGGLLGMLGYIFILAIYLYYKKEILIEIKYRILRLI